MSWSRFVPTASPQLRKWFRIRKDILKNQNNFLVSLLTNQNDRILPPPLTLYDFADPDDAKDASLSAQSYQKEGGAEKNVKYCRWGISDDQVIGGYSTGHFQMMHSINNDNNFLPFLRFYGNTDTRIGPTSRAIRSGFCAIRTPRFLFGSLNLTNPYNALELTCRSDGRLYTVNLKVSTYFPEDLYQSFITIPNTKHMERKQRNKSRSKIETMDGDGDFVRVILPFKEFVLTKNGSMLETQRLLDGPIDLEHVGVTIMDEVDGNFVFDLARIRAVNYYQGMILGEDDEDSINS